MGESKFCPLEAGCAREERLFLCDPGASLASQLVKNPPAMQEALVRFLGGEDPLEEGMATHSSILCLENPMDGGAWRTTVLGVAKSLTRLSDKAQHGTCDLREEWACSIARKVEVRLYKELPGDTSEKNQYLELIQLYSLIGSHRKNDDAKNYAEARSQAPCC